MRVKIYDILGILYKRIMRERALRVIPGGNKVDGLPPVPRLTRRALAE